LSFVLSVLFVLSVCLLVCDVGVLWPNGWMIKMKLGTEVGLGPGDIVLDGGQAPPKGTHTKIFGPCRGQTVAHLSYWWALVPSCAHFVNSQ